MACGNVRTAFGYFLLFFMRFFRFGFCLEVNAKAVV